MIYGEKNVEKPIRWAMVGGGKGSQIGYIHRSAALRDFNFELVAGAFDADPVRGKEFGENLHAATRTTKPCLRKKPSARTVSRRFPSQPRISLILKSPGRPWKPGCTSTAKSRCASPRPKPKSWKRWSRRPARSCSYPTATPATR